jgi:hypothetical protein
MKGYSKKYPTEEGVYYVRLCGEPSSKEVVLTKIVDGKLAVTFAMFRRRGPHREYTQRHTGRWYFMEDIEKLGNDVLEWRKVRIR